MPRAAARLIAPSQDIATGEWTSVAGVGDGIADLATALFWVVRRAGLTVAFYMAIAVAVAALTFARRDVILRGSTRGAS